MRNDKARYKLVFALGVVILVGAFLLVVLNASGRVFAVGPTSPSQEPVSTREPLGSQPLPPAEGTNYAAGELLVRFKDEVPSGERLHTLEQKGLKVLDQLLLYGILRVQVPQGQELQWAEILTKDPLIRYAEPNYYKYAIKPPKDLERPLADVATGVGLAIIPNDTYFNTYQWNMRKINGPQAWDLNTGSNSIILAVLDTGIDYGHPDLSCANKLTNGYDFINDDNNPQDDEGHGTHVAGIAGACSNNGVGMAGVNWNVKIMPVKVLDASGEGSVSAEINGIKWAVDNGAKVLNLSLGAPGYIQSEADAVNYAYTNGVLFIASSGNSYEDGNPVNYPAAYDHVMAVAATGDLDEHAAYSSSGFYVDIAAPGGNATSGSDPNPNHWILSTYWRGTSGYPAMGYMMVCGTSQAAPHVAGLAAMIFGINPGLTPDQVQAIIQNTAVDLGTPGRDELFGYGQIDMQAAVIAATSPTATPTATPTPTPTPTPTNTPTSTPTTRTPTPTGSPPPGYTIYLPIIMKVWPPIPDVPVLHDISNPDGDGNYTVSWSPAARATSYTLEEDDNPAFSSPTTQYSGSGTSWTVSDKETGTYYYRVRASNSWGNSGWSNVQLVSVQLGKFYPIADTTVLQGYPNDNFGSTEDMWVGYDHCLDGKIARSLVQFDVSSIPAGTPISQATLYLYLVNSCDIGERTHTVTVYRTKAGWSESSVTWNTKPGYAEAYGSASIPSRSWGWYSFDVTNLVRGWVNGSFANYGLMIRGPESSGNDSAQLGFFTLDMTGRTYDPYLSIVYAGMATAGEVVPAVDGIPNLTKCGPTIKDMLSTSSGASDFGLFEAVEETVCSLD